MKTMHSGLATRRGAFLVSFFKGRWASKQRGSKILNGIKNRRLSQNGDKAVSYQRLRLIGEQEAVTELRRFEKMAVA
ncbi:MAG: hypothetical protein IJS96_09675 [Schwartzia sp.]|nr:hypothetical protein [Schwartzia sp. (in: firmicutes)]